MEDAELGTMGFKVLGDLASWLPRVCAFVGLLSIGLPAGAQTNEVERFRNALIDYFLPLNYIPVLVNRGYAVGDVIDVDGVNLFAHSQRCFPRLRPPEPVDASLDNAIESDAAGISFGLKLRQIFGSTAGADLTRRFQIRFSDVKVLAVPRLDLKDALDRSACPEIAPLVDGAVTALDRNRPPYFVVSEIIYGKREAVLEFANKVNLESKAERLVQQVGEASLSVQASTGGVVVVKSDSVLPIAMKPVTVPRVITVADLDHVRGDQQHQLAWQPLECDSRQTCQRLFSPFADLIRLFEPKLSDQDLQQ